MIKCSECGNEYQNTNKYCPNCGCPNDDVTNNVVENRVNNYSNNNSKNISIETEKNINFFNSLANFIIVFTYIICFISCIGLISISVEEDSPGVFFLGLLGCGFYILAAYIAAASLRWKALTLKNIYEINISVSNKKK